MIASHPRDFLELSQEIGTDPCLIQGAGGNTSYKSDGALWIKASGTRLSASLNDDIFIPVDLGAALEEIHGNGDGSLRNAVLKTQSRHRPSIETTLHAAFPQKYVFHWHSISSICHSVSIEGRKALPDKLSGLAWVSTPYCHPGIELTHSVLGRLKRRPDANVVILENHGIVVAGNNVDEIRNRISDIERRLALPATWPKAPTQDQPQVESWDSLPPYSGLATDPLMRERVCGGSYYPDHVVFLGPGLQVATLDEMKQPASRERLPFPVVLVPDIGVYIRPDAVQAAHEALICIHNVLVRIPEEWTVCPIGCEAEAKLLESHAEKHRQALARRQ